MQRGEFLSHLAKQRLPLASVSKTYPRNIFPWAIKILLSC